MVSRVHIWTPEQVEKWNDFLVLLLSHATRTSQSPCIRAPEMIHSNYGILQKLGIAWTQVKVCAFCLNYPTWRKVKHPRMIKATIWWQTYIPEVMKTGSANLGTQLLLSNVSLFTVLFTADVGFFGLFSG